MVAQDSSKAKLRLQQMLHCVRSTPSDCVCTLARFLPLLFLVGLTGLHLTETVGFSKFLRRQGKKKKRSEVFHLNER